MKKTIIIFLLFGCAFYVSRCLGFTYPTGKVTVCSIDERGRPLENIHTSVIYSRSKTGNPWDGVKYQSIKGYTDSKGLFSTTYMGFDDLHFRLSKDTFYPSKSEYTFEKEDGVLWHPWNPTITLRLRAIKNPIPMYAKAFVDMQLPQPEMSYDFIKGDFMPPHGSGEVPDCVFFLQGIQIPIPSSSNTYWAVGTFRVSFPGEFNGLEPVYEKDLVRESEFIWPYEAFDGAYTTRHIEWVYKSTRIPGSIPFTKTPEADALFFRIRAEKHPDGTFKSAHYGKMHLPRTLIVRYDDREEKMIREIQGLTFYVNPTRNDRNMEFNPDNAVNLSFKEYVRHGAGVWFIAPKAYKKGEFAPKSP